MHWALWVRVYAESSRDQWALSELRHSFCQEAELITKFLPMLMSFVVDDYTFNVDQKLPAEEKAPVTYPNTLPESFTK